MCGRRFTREVSFCPDDGIALRKLSRQEAVDARLGQVFAKRYRLTGLVGKGGMGTVYRARQLDFDRMVAIKVLNTRPSIDSQEASRFHREAETLAQMHHPHIIRLFDFGQTDSGRLYMVMELLDGEPLNKRLWREGLTYREIFNIMMPVCDALCETHSHKIIHRDLKTENIFILSISACNQAFPKLLDFGVAKDTNRDSLTGTGWVCGTPAYMSPEIVAGEPVTIASDMYSMGVLLYDLLSGTLPFKFDSYYELAHAHLKQKPKPLTTLPGLQALPKRLDDLVMSLLSKDPRERPTSMAVLYRHLQAIRDDCFDAQRLEITPAFERFSATEIRDTLADNPWPKALRINSGQSSETPASMSLRSPAHQQAAIRKRSKGERPPIEWEGTNSSGIRRISPSKLERIRQAPRGLDTAQLQAIVDPKSVQDRRTEPSIKAVDFSVETDELPLNETEQLEPIDVRTKAEADKPSKVDPAVAPDPSLREPHVTRPRALTDRAPSPHHTRETKSPDRETRNDHSNYWLIPLFLVALAGLIMWLI